MTQRIVIPSQLRRAGASHRCGHGIFHLLPAMFFIICQPLIEQAHAEPGQMELGAKLAPSLEKHNGDRGVAEHAYKQGLSLGAEFRYGVLDFLSLQAELLYATRGTDIEVDGVFQGGFSFTYLQAPLLVRGEWRIPALAKDGGRPPLLGYVFAGPAVGYLLGAERTGDGGQQELPRSDLNELDVSVLGGLGVLWNITPQWGASFEVRYDMGFIDSFKNAADGLETKNRAILLTLGVSYTLNDSDGDRMYGGRDMCPLEAEDRNGHKDSDGCADAGDDDDQDGVAFSDDECPEEAEDKDGFEDTDGCRELDNDGDGLADAEDRCPDKAFPYNRADLHDKRGCPPDLRYVRVEGDRIVVDPPLQFRQYSSELGSAIPPLLNEVKELMTTYYPNMRVSIQGHSDGDARTQEKDPKGANDRESSKRAEAVEKYLIEQGIAPGRLESEGFGTSKPISHEGTDESRARNRRVELIIIENPLPPAPKTP